jgi:Acyl-CoA synthetases (AMP-forming)/AMP-acid ligases II
VLHDGLYHTGDVAQRDADGYYTFVGRTDDVFKSPTTASARSSWKAC